MMCEMVIFDQTFDEVTIKNVPLLCDVHFGQENSNVDFTSHFIHILERVGEVFTNSNLVSTTDICLDFFQILMSHVD